MNQQSIKKRIAALEALKPDLLLLFCTDEQGLSYELTVDEFERLQNSAIEFDHIISGGSLSDLDRLLNLILPVAMVE